MIGLAPRCREAVAEAAGALRAGLAFTDRSSVKLTADDLAGQASRITGGDGASCTGT
jgi:hypothetical protein